MAWEPQADVARGFADEAALVAGLREGRREAFEALHGAYARAIYSLALRIVDDPHDAQDVAQEVLLKVLRGLPQQKGELNLPAWLYRVTVNAAFDHVRARRRRPVVLVDEVAPETSSPVDDFERAELARRVESTLHELPKRQQVALVLRDVHGLSVRETASVLGVTRGSADVLLSRARAGFRRIFLAGTTAAGRCREADRAIAAGVGGGNKRAMARTAFLDHARTCPDCRRTVELWGAAPVGLGLLLPLVSVPPELSIGAVVAAAHTAGIALPSAGMGAATLTVAPAAGGAGGAAAAGGSVTAAGGTAAAAGGTAAAAAAVPAAPAAAGLLAAVGSAAGVKVATLAVAATAIVGLGGLAARQSPPAAGRAPEHAGFTSASGAARVSVASLPVGLDAARGRRGERLGPSQMAAGKGRDGLDTRHAPGKRAAHGGSRGAQASHGQRHGHGAPGAHDKRSAHVGQGARGKGIQGSRAARAPRAARGTHAARAPRAARGTHAGRASRAARGTRATHVASSDRWPAERGDRVATVLLGSRTPRTRIPTGMAP